MKAHVFVRLVFAALFGVVANGAVAAQAVFSADGTKVYCCTFGEGELGVVDLAAKTYKLIKLKEPLKALAINGLARSNSGNILLTTERAVWAWDPVKDKVVKVADAEKKYTLEDLAYDPRSEDILITADEKQEGDQTTSAVLMIKKGKSKAGAVFARRVEWVRGLAFDKEGKLFFGGNGDLWAGEITPSDEVWSGTLTAYRVAPLATFETAEHNGIQEAVNSVAVAGEWLYVGVGNRYSGNLVRLPKPKLTQVSAEEGLNTHQDLKERWGIMGKALASAELVAKVDSVAKEGMLCVSADGARIFYQGGDDEGKVMMLIEGGKTRQIARVPSE